MLRVHSECPTIPSRKTARSIRGYLSRSGPEGLFAPQPSPSALFVKGHGRDSRLKAGNDENREADPSFVILATTALSTPFPPSLILSARSPVREVRCAPDIGWGIAVPGGLCRRAQSGVGPYTRVQNAGPRYLPKNPPPLPSMEGPAGDGRG